MAGERGLAEQIRTGLEEGSRPVAKVAPVLRVIQGKNPLEQIFHGRKVREHVRDFGALFALIFAVIAGVVFYRGTSDVKALSYLGVSAILMVLGAYAPQVLRPVWDLWMKLAEKLSIVMTFVILMLAWCAMVVPMAFLLRLIRVKVMDMDFRLPVESYWQVRPEKLHDFKLLERQF